MLCVLDSPDAIQICKTMRHYVLWIQLLRERLKSRALAEAQGLRTRVENVLVQFAGKGQFNTVTMELADDTLVGSPALSV